MAEPVPTVRVAIVGGGCAGIATAWQLSEFARLAGESASASTQPQPRFEITVYEQSWRLGGKGASGRDAHGRIREHGLHIWLGFYENAFRMMRDCYQQVQQADWGPRGEGKAGRQPLPQESFEDAFFPEPHIAVASPAPGGQWQAWSGFLPPMKGLPGDPLDEHSNPFTLAGYLARCIGLVKALIHSGISPPSGVASPEARSRLDETIELDFSFDAMQSPGVMLDSMTRLLRVGTLASAAGLLQGVNILEQWLREHNPAPQFASTVLSFMEALATQLRRQLGDFVSIDPELRRKTEVIDLIITIVVGLYRDRVLFDARGLDALNHIDCKDWLRKHGALPESVESPFVTGLYDLAFCYREGDRSQPALACGQALRGALRMFFSYRGALFWHMRSGMGDTVFAPLYRVLRERGVRFRFMHRLEGIDFSEDLGSAGARVEALRFGIPGDRAGVEAFSDAALDAAGCWRHDRPAGFPEGQGQTIVLADGAAQGSPDAFDAVVFAMGIDDFRAVCQHGGTDTGRPRLFDRLPRWNAMQKHVTTVGTQSAQVWLDRSVEELGWKRGAVVVSALEHPFESWADMTHTFGAERAWRRAHGNARADLTRSVAYFVGLLSDKDIAARDKDPKKLEALVRDNLRQLLTERIAPLWPDAFRKLPDGGKPDSLLSHLVGKDGTKAGSGEKRLDEQHVMANFHGSERYTLALPGSLEHRISPLDMTVANMTIAGDWTECGFNEGCVEAAVMSGMLASHALCGFPALEDIVGYDHP